ncbi:uncharacterized protein PHACADRAFT_184595 [Phanerochaete carnosa HHB-10118-sp]|uniref:Uncharacterized protein n=1 Tax=Phanerochaete carnosa (strain HHB-10118-sp) TaxID=650164 RepID=K5V067_PHACS|nr:uncharacterized protein PHACADRAFT_184595 [Phanerochaete carnosa HHB-10118-sp]EKM55836.1 hypothetical protein PHACADRAFT_184595 [Phanerochaete carnosa HHB-10118-sp]
MAATWHDMPFIRVVDESRPIIDDGFQLLQHAYARQDPSIRYRGFEMSLRANTSKPEPTPSDRPRGIHISAPKTVPGLIASSLLLPLDVARQCKHITHRREGFEMNEARKHLDIEAVRNGWF